jgi:hypothetical protein
MGQFDFQHGERDSHFHLFTCHHDDHDYNHHNHIHDDHHSHDDYYNNHDNFYNADDHHSDANTASRSKGHDTERDGTES